MSQKSSLQLQETQCPENVREHPWLYPWAETSEGPTPPVCRVVAGSASRADPHPRGLCLAVFQLGFYKGPAGSQVTLSSLGNQTRVLLEEQARHLLTEQERATLAYYLEEYRGGSVSVEALVMALFQLLNTHAKVTRASSGKAGLEGPGFSSRGFCILPCLPLNPTPSLRTHKESDQTEAWAEPGDGDSPHPQTPQTLKGTVHAPCTWGPNVAAFFAGCAFRIVWIALKKLFPGPHPRLANSTCFTRPQVTKPCYPL